MQQLIMPILEINLTPEEQLEKIREEFMELEQAINNNDLDNILEEAFDLVQATVGLQGILCRNKVNISKADLKHVCKLLDREKQYSKVKNREWKYKGTMMKISFGEVEDDEGFIKSFLCDCDI